MADRRRRIRAMTIKDDANEALRKARAQRAQQAAEAAERFRMKHEPHAVAGLAFLGVHLALVAVAATFIADGYEVEVQLLVTPTGSGITVTCGRRMCRFTLRLYDAAVEGTFCGEGFKTWQMAWNPPSTLDYSAHYEQAALLAKEALVFVVGSADPGLSVVKP